MKKQGFSFDNASNLNLSLSSIITDAGRFILFLFKVILTSFPSISMTSHNIVHISLTYSGINFPAILNKCMLPAALHNFTGTYYWASDMKNIILTAFENKCLLNSFYFLAFRIMKIIVPKIDRLNMHIVYHWILQVHSISCVTETCSCLVTVPTSLNCCKTRLVTKDFNLVCLHIMHKTIDVTTNEIIAVINRKNVYSIIVRKGVFVSQI